MSKYYKAEDVILKYAEMIAIDAYRKYGVGDGEVDEDSIDIAKKCCENLPSIELSDDCINGFREGQKDMFMFLLEGMKNALEEARNERIDNE